MSEDGKWVTVAFYAFLGAYVAVEAYYSGQRRGKQLASDSAHLPADDDENHSPSESPTESAE